MPQRTAGTPDSVTERRTFARIVSVLFCLAGCQTSTATPSVSTQTSKTAVPIEGSSSAQSSAASVRPPPQTLPGETDVQAMDRILVGCYTELGVEVGPKQPDGSRSVNGGTPEAMQNAVDTCQQRLVDAGLAGDFPLTDKEIQDNYDRIKTYRQCLIDHGHPLPAMISFDEYAATRGKSDQIDNGVSEALSSLTKTQFDALNVVCPQG